MPEVHIICLVVCNIMASQCHSSWRLFHLSLLPGQITYYITVHLISKDMLMTPLNKDETSCSGILPAPKHVSLLHVYVCAPTSVCHKTNNGPPILKPFQTLLNFYHPLTRKLVSFSLCFHSEQQQCLQPLH